MHKNGYIIKLVLVLLFLLFPVSVLGDVTEELDFQKLFDDHGSIMLIVNPQTGQIVYANQVALDFYGYAREDLLLMKISEINTLSQEAIAEEMARAAREERNYFLFEHRLSSGEIREVEVSSYPARVGEHFYLFSVIHDVTEERKLATALEERRQLFVRMLMGGIVFSLFLILLLYTSLNRVKESNKRSQENANRLQSYIDGAPDGVSVVDARGQSLLVNHALAEMSGYTVDELMGMRFWDVISPQDIVRVEEGFAILSRENPGAQKTMEYQVLTKNDQVRTWRVTRVKLDEESYLGFIKDVTEIKEYQEALVREKNRAEAANHAKSQFIANMSHEIRTPLNGVFGYLQLLRETGPSEEQKAYLDRMEKSASFLLEVINDVLEISKMESGTYQLQEIPFSFPTMVTELGEFYKGLAGQKGLDFQLEVNPALPETLVGDPLRLKQVFSNILNNAMKFTERGEVRMLVEPLGEDRIQVTVSDTGVGISREALSKLFHRFMQEDASHTRKFGGSGLGLSIARELLEMMAGSIRVESEQGKGTQVIMEIPAILHHGISEEKKEVPVNTLLPPMQPEQVRILLVEDDEINRELFTKMLALRGYRVEVAENGRQGVEKALSGDYHMVFMDCQMPEMDGFAATRLIKAEKSELPVVAITAFALKEDQEECWAAGMDGHIPKPFQLEKILECIQFYAPLLKQ